jgi:biopolymer transport protein ExbB
MSVPGLDFFKQGGPFMVPLAVCSLVSLTIILERGFALRRARVISPRLESVVELTPPSGQVDAVNEALRDDRSTFGRLLGTALAALGGTRAELQEAVQVRARQEVLRLERGVVGLEIVTGVAPLLGLLGTVSGLVHIFEGIGSNVSAQGPQIARGIAEALNTTIAGLVVAVPSLIFHSLYTRRIEGLASELEGLSSEFLAKVTAAGAAPPDA